MQLRGTRGVAALFCALIAMLGIAAIGTGCGGDDSSDASAKDSSQSGIPKTAPKLEPPAGLPPRKLVVEDVSEGTGATAKKGDRVALHYNCIVWGSGVNYSNSWTYSGPPTFRLGEKLRLLRGLNLAVPGMKEGGGREVQIPNTLVYYPDVPHPPVRRLDALLCQVYLVKVLEQKQGPQGG